MSLNPPKGNQDLANMTRETRPTVRLNYPMYRILPLSEVSASAHAPNGRQQRYKIPTNL